MQSVASISSGLVAVLVVGAIVLALALAMALAAWFADPTDPARMSSPWRHDVRLEGTLDANAVTAGAMATSSLAASSISTGALLATSLNTGAASVSGALTAGSMNAGAASVSGALTAGSLSAGAASFTNVTTSGLNVLTDAQIGGRVNAADGLFMPVLQLTYDNTYAPTWNDPVAAGAAFPFDARMLGLRRTGAATTYARYVDATVAGDYNLYQNDESKFPAPPAPPSTLLTGGYAVLDRAGRWLVHVSLTVRGSPAGLPEFQVGLMTSTEPRVLSNLPRTLQDRGGVMSRVLTAPMKSVAPLPGSASITPGGATAFASGTLTVVLEAPTPVALVPLGIRSAGPIGGMTQERTLTSFLNGVFLNGTFLSAYYLGR